MKAILAPFAGLNIAFANSYVVLHADWLLVLSKLDLAVLGDCDFPLLFALALSFTWLVFVVFHHWLCCGSCCTRCWF